MKAVYVILLLATGLLSFGLPACIILLITIICGIKLYKRHHLNFKQELYQKDQEIAVIKNELCKERETRRLIIEEHAETVSSLHREITFLTAQKETSASTFLHTSILTATEYDRFIHYFQISHPCLLDYLRAPEFKLTSYEIILCLLAYLNTPASHIECLLEKKYDTLKKARQRIKSKMQINGKDNIGDFLREKMR